MSGGTVCTCKLKDRSKWVILQYRANCSAFNGYRTTPSNYSLVYCSACGTSWRTKAAYVNTLPFGSRNQQDTLPTESDNA